MSYEFLMEFLNETDITISLVDGIVTIKYDGSIRKLWAFNESNHPKFELRGR